MNLSPRIYLVILSSLSIFVLSLFLGWIGLTQEHKLSSELIEKAASPGSAFRYKVEVTSGFWLQATDSIGNERVSELELFEEGQPLGPAHSVHTTIGFAPFGKFSHWGDYVTFSSSDGTSPKTNGRKYYYTSRIYIKKELAFAGLVAALVLAVAGFKMIGFSTFLKHAKSAFAPAAAPLISIGISIACLAVIFLVGELYLRATTPFVGTKWPSRFDPEVGFTFQPNSEVRHTNGLDFWISGKTNSLGFLDREPPKTDGQESCHIVAIGDSMVEAAQVEISEKFHVLLEDSLRQLRPELNVTSSAFGYSGTGQLNQLTFFDSFAENQKPSLIILPFVLNDFANNSVVFEALRNGWSPSHLPRRFAKKDQNGNLHFTRIDPQWQRHLLPTPAVSSYADFGSSSYFFLWLKNLYAAYTADGPSEVIRVRQKALAREAGFEKYFQDWKPSGFAQLDRMFMDDSLTRAEIEALEMTDFALSEFKKRTEKTGAELLILATSSLIGPENNDRLLQLLMQMAEKNDIPLVDQMDTLRSHGKTADDARFSFDGHWNKEGHKWASETIVDYFLKNAAKICGS